MKYEKREEARRLRGEKGLSLKEISEVLSVSKSSVSLWVRDIKLTDEQISKLSEKCLSYKGDHSKFANDHRNKRIKYREEGAKKIENIDLFLCGCLLYWAEGSKKRNMVAFSNTDVNMLKLFVRFLLECFDGISANDIKVGISCYLSNNIKQEEIEKYWLSELGLPKESLYKTSIVTKHPMSKGYKKNKHLYGVCQLQLHRTDVVQEIYGGILKVSKDKSDKWLD